MITKDFKKRLLQKDDPFQDILGQDTVKHGIKSALLSGRNLLLVGPPGIGKTTLAKNILKLLGKDSPFMRIQGSPDLTVEDLLGDIDPIKAMQFGPLSLEAFTKGKIFKAHNGVLFFDEVNRCPEKVQNSLLQVLEEKKTTLGSYDVDFDINFIFIGTMNPEDAQTEKLSDVFLDRFDVIYMGYPETAEIEKRIVVEKSISSENVEMPENILNLMIMFIRMLREDKNLEKKPSVRASLGLYERSMANALLEGRNEVTFDDLKKVVVSVLAHRIRLKPSVKYLQNANDYLSSQFEKYMSTRDELQQEGDLL